MLQLPQQPAWILVELRLHLSHALYDSTPHDHGMSCTSMANQTQAHPLCAQTMSQIVFVCVVPPVAFGSGSLALAAAAAAMLDVYLWILLTLVVAACWATWPICRSWRRRRRHASCGTGEQELVHQGGAGGAGAPASPTQPLASVKEEEQLSLIRAAHTSYVHTPCCGKLWWTRCGVAIFPGMCVGIGEAG